VLFYFINDVIFIISSLMNIIFNLFNSISYNEIICQLSNATQNTVSTTSNVSHNTTVQIVHSDGTWSNTIRTLFIYGTGAFRLSLQRGGGTPGSRAFVVVSTITADTLTRIVNCTINDPSYVRNHYENWKAIWVDSVNGTAEVRVDSETVSQLNTAQQSVQPSQSVESLKFCASPRRW
jgi:hypothetical protein